MNAPGQRSGIPKVVGILMIIFASLGLIGSLIGLTGGKGSETGDAWKTFYTFELVFSIVGLAVSGLHLFAGLQAVRYKANGPKLSMMYGAIAIVAQLAYAVLLFVVIKPKLMAGDLPDGVDADTARAFKNAGNDAVNTVLGTFAVVKVVLFSIWPILVLALMSRPAAKASSTN